MEPLSSAQKSDVLILGGGVIGLACALALLREGRSVTVLEKDRAGSGSSYGNCGTITPSHLPLHAPGAIGRALKWMLTADAPFYVRPRWDPELFTWMLNFAALCNARDFRRVARVKSALLLRSRELLGELVRTEKLDCEFRDSGTLYVWRDPVAFEAVRGEQALLNELGVPCERLEGAAVRNKEPALNDSVLGGHWHPGDASLRPDRYVAELARAVRAAGGLIEEQVEALGLRSGAGRIEVVWTTRGDYVADEVVLALGAWSPALLRRLELRLPIQPGKGYSITYAPSPAAPHIPLVLKERSVCVTAWGGGSRLGSTMEFSGYDMSLNRRRLDALPRAAAEYLRQPPSGAVQEEWYGWRPMTHDDLPIIGRAPGQANLMLATGHGMLGVSLSAVSARLVADLICGHAPIVDPAICAPERLRL